MSLLRRSGQQALQALLELAKAPQQWRSVNEIAAAQALPAPMLEQLLLQLRRAGLVEARRGRLGGYRLQRQPAAIPVAEVLAAVGADIQLVEPDAPDSTQAEEQVLRSMARRLQRAMERELMQFNLEELLFDLRSCRETLSGEGGLMLG
ncbi:Rrf2 family transcriptional regulator [Synechococcus sp. CBW1107]|jgi:Rrf2 family transcriptional regulator, iron-sulfur cluster assembly transcription factor|uniref:Rrf2 family transcriptional regulator n=1 Tax=Synechococcus sp. CBW1107 TaxID=2789857 RepID=UPI002AD550D4|nr:Rrf2 family transcriptional regulator [Synechococcus sp. CBW1107]CAK6690864.1 HTH-type transcriptional regulator CymR [Synechococcus sp. CBW1107]